MHHQRRWKTGSGASPVNDGMKPQNRIDHFECSGNPQPVIPESQLGCLPPPAILAWPTSG